MNHNHNQWLPKRSAYSSYKYYCNPMVTPQTRNLIRQIPAFIAPTFNEYCDYYIIPDVFPQPSSSKVKSVKYGKRSQKMLIKAQQGNSNTSKPKSMVDHHEAIKKDLKIRNPNIKIMEESKITRICKTWHDVRIDAIIKKRRKNNPSTKDEISYFITDKISNSVISDEITIDILSI